MVDNQKTGVIFNTQKFSIHDGGGIRTLIFMKGCPLRCIWCSNPESQKMGVEIMDVRTNCISCGKCFNLCENGGIDPETYLIDYSLCIGCSQCADFCYANAKKTVGKVVTLEELMKIIEKDRIFYKNSGGGVTIGGGEPLAQYEFVEELLRMCQSSNIHTAIETSGYGKWEHVRSVFHHCDQIFFDLKHMDDETHRRLTGVGNASILQNARQVAALGKNVIFRIPLIQGYNDEENVAETGKFVRSLDAAGDSIRIELLPYHNFGQDKYRWLDRDYALQGMKPMDKNVIQEYNNVLSDLGCNIVG